MTTTHEPHHVPVRRTDRVNGWRRRVHELQNDRGAITAEYAVVILAAVAFAGVLVAIMRSSEVRAILLDLVQQALSAAG